MGLFRRKPPTPPPSPDAILRYGWSLQQRQQEKRERDLRLAYSQLEREPRLLELYDTPLVLADMHRRLQELEA